MRQPWICVEGVIQKPWLLWCLSMDKAVVWLGLTRAGLKANPRFEVQQNHVSDGG